MERRAEVVGLPLQIGIRQVEIAVLYREIEAGEQRESVISHNIAERELSQSADTVEGIKTSIRGKNLWFKLHFVLADFEFVLPIIERHRIRIISVWATGLLPGRRYLLFLCLFSRQSNLV